MKLNKDVIKDVINYVIENQTFDLDEGCMDSIGLLTVVNDLSGDNDNKRQEISTALYRCLQEELLYSNYPNTMWGKAVVFDVTFKGFAWLEDN